MSVIFKKIVHPYSTVVHNNFCLKDKIKVRRYMNLIKNLSIGFKVALAPVVAVICLIILGAVAWLANTKLDRSIQILTQETIPNQNKISDLKLKAVFLNRLTNQSLAWEGAGFQAEQIKVLDLEIVKQAKALGDEVKNLNDDKNYNEINRQSFSELLTEYAKFSKTLNEILDLKSGGLATAAGYMSTLDASFARMDQILTEVGKRQIIETSNIVTNAQNTVSQNNLAIVMVLLIASIVCTGVAVLVVKMIVSPLQEAVSLAETMAHGNFTKRTASFIYNDATGRVLHAMNEVSEKLGAIVWNIRHSAQAVDIASGELAQGNVDLSSRTENTASALEQTSAALKELSGQVKESASFARDANQIAKDARAVAEEGGSVVLEAVQIMEKINAQARKISEIIGVIDGIAFQTNILALNAAVEAARAGDQGRGFAVVAQEVRTLAQRSASAAKEIRELISTSVEQAEIGAEKVRMAGNTMERVVSTIRDVGSKVDEISRTSQLQADGFSQVEVAVTEMDNHTQQNAALVEEASAATMSLQTQAQELLQTVAQLKTTDMSRDTVLVKQAPAVTRSKPNTLHQIELISE